MTVYVDTHVLVWLFYGETGMLSHGARHAIEGNEIRSFAGRGPGVGTTARDWPACTIPRLTVV